MTDWSQLGRWMAALVLPLSAVASPDAALMLLEQNCLQCHGSAAMSGLDIRTPAGLAKGGNRGPAIVPGHPERSLLVQVLDGSHELKMPMGEEPLAAEAVAVIAEWVRSGAAFEREELTSSGEPWWAFQKPRRPQPPGAAKNPIDAFIAAKLEAEGLEALPRADRRMLIRRAYFDLHGLPPSPEAVEAFVADKSPDAWANLIDELLDSPRYGERWGRHWLDVVRYADTGGFETDIHFPDAWRYRDYVIDSFNQDKPFDRFILEQVAGDEIWPDDIELRGGYKIPEEKQRHLEARIGTGLYTIGPVYHEAALDGRQLRYEWMTDAVDTTSAAFLGLTLGCARCHDHKFDPLSQRDYHRMMAIFAGSEPRRIPTVHKMNEFGFYSSYPRLLKVEEYQNAIKRIDKRARDRVQREIESRFPAEVLAAYKVPKDDRTPEQRELAAKLEGAFTKGGLKENASGQRAALQYLPGEKDERERLIYQLGEAALATRFEMAQATVLAPSAIQYPTEMTSRGDFRGTGETVEPGLPAVFESDPNFSAGKRTGLARWLASPGHPLTARVMVNRIWQGHFGRGIVGTANDFGRQGDTPTHPELLDWLATDFIDGGWSVKRMHRLILASDAYQRSSAPHAGNAARDAENRYLWRMNRRRLEAETLRDSVLAVSGELNLKAGGRPVAPPLTADEMRGMWATHQWPTSLDAREHNRRSVYMYVKRSFPFPMFAAFDQPDSSVSCSRRDVTTVAPQALALLNSEFMQQRAQGLAKRVRESSSDAEWVDAIWRFALGRQPDQAEAERARSLLAQGGDQALTELCLLALNLNEFLYID